MTTFVDECNMDPTFPDDDAPASDATHTARATYRSVVADVAARAKEKLPAAVNGRVEKATRLVLQHDVLFLSDGTVEVGSSSDPMRVYHVRGRACECQDFTSGKAPEGWCQHVVAACMQQRVDAVMAIQQQAATAAPAEPVQGIDPKFIVWISNRPFVRHAGLLKLAHERGLQSLTVEWTYNDAELSLAHAIAVFADGRRFEESADSTPQNVGKKVALHWRRLSLTRASARALRLALGVDLVAVEELMDNE